MKNTIASYMPELIALRHDLHQHPELGFEEERTSRIVAEHLEKSGIEVHTGWAKTGVVGVLRRGSSLRTLALRADMDALPLQEKATLDYASTVPGVMHACGHDGHIAILLGAARYLAEKSSFDGTVVFIFQPAEEGGGGGRLMTEEGIIEEYGIQSVYGLHNRSGLEKGTLATRTGAIMAATDNFEITVHGLGTHAAMPHTGIDPITIGSHLVTALQTVTAREINAFDSVVLSVTQFIAGTAYNVIPDDAVLRGCTRYRRPETGTRLKEAMERTCAGVCAAHGAHFSFSYMPGYPPTVNAEQETESALRAAREVAGAGMVDDQTPALMASEDFSFFLEKVPGCYIFLGNGTHTESHRSDYDFSDDIMPVGINYWVTLTEQELGKVPV